MAQRVKVLSADLEDMSLILGTYVVEGEDRLLKVVF